MDDGWFSSAPAAEILGIWAKIAPPEEMIWQKAYVMERERFDGADIIHLLASCAGRIDWTRLIERFGPDWRVLLSHLVLFGFVFPSKRNLVPPNVIEQLSARLMRELADAAITNALGVLRPLRFGRGSFHGLLVLIRSLTV